MRATLRRGDRWEGQAINYRKDGSPFVMEWSIIPLRDAAGRIANYVAVQRDVTARVEAEQRIAQAQADAREADRIARLQVRPTGPKDGWQTSKKESSAVMFLFLTLFL